MVSLKEVPARHYLQAFLLLFVIMTLAFSTRWVSGKKILFEVLWDPSSLQLIYPCDKIEAQAYPKGKAALWIPYRGFGSSILIPAGIQLAHPLKVLSFLWGTDNGLEMELLLRLVLAGFFAYMLARGMGLGHPAGMLAGSGFMLCGYFRQFSNFVDINVSMFYPLVILFLLRFFRERRFYDFLLAVWSGYLAWTGGHPEAVYYLPALAASAGLYAWLENSVLKKEKPLPGLAKAAALIVLIVVFWHSTLYVILPFWEMVANSWAYHPEGMGRLHFDARHMIALLTPVFDLWLEAPRCIPGNLIQFTVIPSYLGFVLGSLALLAVIELRKANRMICYFLLLSLFLLGIVFAAPGFNLVTYLPMVDRFQNFRYPQPILALSTAILAGYGFDRLQDPVSRKIYLGLVAALGAWLLYHFLAFRHFLAQSPLFLAAGFLLLFFLAAILILYFSERRKIIYKTNLKSAIFAGCVMELFCYFVFASPFYGAEAFRIEKPGFPASAKIEPEFFRFYSPDQHILPPNTASLFGLRDVRDRTPLYPKDYYRFLAALNRWETDKEATEEFLEGGAFYLPLRLDRIPESAQNLLFGYLAVNQRLDRKDLMDELYPGSLKAPRPNYFARNAFDLLGKTRPGFLVHPPGKMTSGQKIESGEIEFALGFIHKPGSKSDGADFVIIGDSPGKTRLLFARFLPYSESASRGWIDYKLKTGAPAQIGMATLPGPKADDTQDFALFGAFSAPAPAKASSHYRLVSDAGPFLYKRLSAVPRFFFTENVQWVKEREDALVLVKQGGLSRENTFLAGENPFPDGPQKAEGSASRAMISLVRDETDLTELELELAVPGWMVMLDAYYPGWKAFIDKKEARIFRADYMFRGVHVPAGKHRLKFIYRPASFEIGLYLNLVWYLAGAFALAFAVFRSRGSAGFSRN